ncbi:uncharacterized protein VTP21DRAFT_211 [Calcarisporiella thermophila]|uniref:uncharacterized protein n=1 Tax=Calcarisporiella thermophila TaxID=911321 RepID=UPI003742A038
MMWKLSLVIFIAIFAAFSFELPSKYQIIFNDNADDHGYDYCEANFPNAEEYTVPANAKLLLTQLVVRHGDRYILS